MLMPFPGTFRRNFAQPAFLALCFAQGFLPLIEAGDQPRPDPPPPAAIPDQQRATYELLRELDRFCDHHPLTENDLRVRPFLLENAAYLGKNPALRQFVAANPDVGTALKSAPRHFLHRALRREANAPLTWSEVAQLDAFLNQYPAIEQQLVGNPALIRSHQFLEARPRLREFLEQNAVLARGFLPAAPTS
jgi:hypothetical protein